MIFFFLISQYSASFSCDADHCSHCNYNSCDKCDDGYYVGSSKCESCHSTCKTCNKSPYPAQCLECYDGFYLKKSNSYCYYDCVGLCNACSDDGLCKKCSQTSPYSCTECNLYSYLDKSVSPNKCKLCHETCETCDGPAANQCITCRSGYYKNGDLCEPCGDNCEKCENSQICINCSAQHYLDSSSQCQKCDNSCRSCHGSTVNDCDECFDGYYDYNGLCRACDPNCKNCAALRNFCIECEDGKYLDEEKHICIDCDPTCKTCNGPDGCLTCADGYYQKNSKDKCTSCQGSQNCATCTYSGSSISCITCIPGYYKSTYSSTCTKSSVEGCYNATSMYACVECIEGYYLEGSTCKKCSNNCTSCPNATTCLACSQGFFLDKETSSCKPCSSNCLKCESSTKCTVCEDNYYRSNDNTCQHCDASCNLCNDNTNACKECAKGYYFNEFKRCMKCGDNCDVCDDSTHCTDCATEYFLRPNGSCSPCADVCFECTGPTSDDCIECDPGYYLSSSLKQCFKCHEACIECTGPNDNQCSKCSPGYYLYSNQCVKCEFGCQNCTSTYNCIQCLPGYYLKNADCIPCEGGCNNCSLGVNQCTKCSEGFYESSRDGDFVNCSLCPYDCKSCHLSNSGDLICNSCNSGYYFDGIACSRCNSPCETCSSANSCNSCVKGHLLEGSSCNSLCSSSCATCDKTATSCTSCTDGFILNGTVCLQCPENCKTCDIEGSSSSCTSCLDGFYLSNEKCLPCDSSCATCKNSYSSGCYTCPEGYYKYNQNNDYTGSCKSCGYNTDHCVKCTSDCSSSSSCKFICTECENGFYLKDGKCAACDSTCKTCDGPSNQNCLDCLDDYFLKDGYCVQCNNLCASCDSDPDKCTSCPSHKYLTNDNKCLECSSECAECKDANSCTKCPKYQFLHEGKCIKSCSQLGEGYGGTINFECQKCNLENCRSYDDACQCLSCNEGYYIVTDPITLIEICVPCPLENCKACGGPELNDCTECNPGYELQTDPSTNNKVCVSLCQEGYFVNASNLCQKCPFPCKICSGIDGSKCKVCEEGYFSNGTHCSFFQDDCLLYKHCENENTGDKPVQIVLETTKFNSFKNEKGGGAIRLVNCGVTGENISFTECVSEHGGGGAIFIFNEKETDYSITLKGLTFDSCKAAFGGAVYAYSISEKNPVIIESCNFINNRVLEPSEVDQNSKFVGGSALYLTVKNGSVDNCNFKVTNRSSYGLIKVSKDFNLNPEESVKILQNIPQDSKLIINDCSFDAENNDSLIYVVEKQTSLEDVTDYISIFGKSNRKKIGIKDKSAEYTDEIKKKLNSKYIIFDSNSYDDVDSKKEIVVKMNSLTLQLSVISLFCLVALIGFIVFYMKNQSDNEQNDEIDNDSINSFNE